MQIREGECREGQRSELTVVGKSVNCIDVERVVSYTNKKTQKIVRRKIFVAQIVLVAQHRAWPLVQESSSLGCGLQRN